jgi:hypothetical protein
MKCRVTLATLLLLAGQGTARAQEARPSLLPMPEATSEPAYPHTLASSSLDDQPASSTDLPAPADAVAPASPAADIAPEVSTGAADLPSESASLADHLGGVLGPADGCCNDLACCEAPPMWFASVAGLIMTRDRPNKLWTTYETGNNPNQLMYTPNTDWAGGGEVRFGRCFGCYHAIEAVYWGLDTLEGEAAYAGTQVPSGTVSTPLNVSDPVVDLGGQTLDQFFDNAAEHRLRRVDEVHNVELNFLNGPLMTGPYGRFQFTYLMGVRFLRFRDGLLFGSVQDGFAFGDNGGVNEAYIQSSVINNLVGFQIGGRADFFFSPRFSIFAMPKVGIYGNDIDLQGRIYRGDGLVGMSVDSNKVDFSMIGELDVGLNYQFSPRWSVFGGYRAIGISGIALADNQIPFYVGDTAEWADVDSNGNLILHGAFAGLQYRF